MQHTTLSRALFVIDQVSKAPEGLRFSEIRARLGQPSPTTVTKILKELVAAEVLVKTDTGAYMLGVKPYFWGKAAGRVQDTMQLIRGHMRQLHADFEASVNLFTCSENRMLCLESFMAPQSPSMWPAGHSLPLELPVIGSVFFFQHSTLAEDDVLQSQVQAHDPGLDFQQVRRMVQTSLETGLQDDQELFYPGVHRFAVPLRKEGNVSMVLGLGVLAARLERGLAVEDVVARLREAQARIEERLAE